MPAGQGGHMTASVAASLALAAGSILVYLWHRAVVATAARRVMGSSLAAPGCLNHGYLPQTQQPSAAGTALATAGPGDEAVITGLTKTEAEELLDFLEG